MAQQPIIRGIEAVGAVSIQYIYNGPGNVLKLPENLIGLNGANASIETENGVEVAGFRLDSNFLRANPQIASSFQIPILGGGAIALTNNNRSGTLNINCTRVSTPVPKDVGPKGINGQKIKNTTKIGAMAQIDGANIGPNTEEVYDLVFLAQVQQAQPGGDSVGATIKVDFQFCGLHMVLCFEGCTIASVDPLGLSGNDAVDYGVSINYLNWTANYSAATGTAYGSTFGAKADSTSGAGTGTGSGS